MTYGLDPVAGFQSKPLDAILSEIEAAQRAAIDPNLDTSSESVIGNLNGIVATKLRELWEQMAIVYSARDPSGATFAALDALAAITGTTRAAATKGSVQLTLTVAAGYTIPAGAIANVAGQPTNQWVTTQAADNSAGGTTASIIVSAQAVTAGKISANAGTITIISSPVVGWLGVSNALDASPGTDADTDAQLRLRREQELSADGTATLEAIRADMLRLTYKGQQIVAACYVDENASSYTDSLGRPPKTIDVLAQLSAWISGASAADQLAARSLFEKQLWLSKPGGIGFAPGTESATVVDSMGIVRTVGYSTPASVPVYVSATVSIDPAHYPGDTALKAAIKAFGDLLLVGQSVIRSKLSAYILDNVAGVLDVGGLAIGRTAFSEREANLAIGPRELATFDTANITVVTA